MLAPESKKEQEILSSFEKFIVHWGIQTNNQTFRMTCAKHTDEDEHSGSTRNGHLSPWAPRGEL